jgi:glycosyltransferase involved in cell wall biosynthesis
MTQKVTVVTVTYNAAGYIEETIQSVVNQTYSNIEYIIIDGASSDGTLGIVDRYRESLTGVISEKDNGLYDAMNKAIEMATGEWIVFMNAGDVFYDKNVLENIFGGYIQEDFVYGDHVWINAESAAEVHVKCRPLDLMWQKISFSHQSLFARVELMKRHKFNLDYSIVSDYEFYFSHYAKGCSFRYVPFPVCKIISGGVSDRLLLRRTLERWNVVRKYYGNIRMDLWYLKFLFSEVMPVLLKKKLTGRKREQFRGAQPLISVIIANYNNEPYLAECIDSVLEQTYSNLEIIIVDDASTDGSIRLIGEYVSGDPRIRLIRNDRNRGIQNVRNQGIAAARGEYITTLDGDDVFYSKDKLQQEMRVVNVHADSDVIAFSDVMLINERSAAKGRVSRSMPIIEGDIFNQIFTRSCFIPRDFLLKKTMLDAVGGYDPEIPIYEDWDLKIRLARRYPFYFSEVVGVGYRRHGAGLSSAPKSYHEKFMSVIVDKNTALIEAHEAARLVAEANSAIGRVAGG